MTWRHESLVLLALLLPLRLSATVFSGEVTVADAQHIVTPPSMNSPVVLRYYAADAKQVKKGDVLLRIDAGSAQTQVKVLQAQLEQATAKNTKDVADLELKLADAQLALASAQADRDAAAIDAVLPKALIPALDYDRHQGEMQRANQALLLKQHEVEQAEAAVQRRQQESELELSKLRLSLKFNQDQVTNAVVYAERDGTVVHDFDAVFGAGGRFEEGSSSYSGNKVGEVVGTGGDFTVKGWVLEPDRNGLHIGEAVNLRFDALPKCQTSGSIIAISGMSTAKNEWGDGRYYEVDIALPAKTNLPLRQGMSVQVNTDLHEMEPPHASLAAGRPAALHVDGEIFAAQSLAISPPAVDGLWQMTVAQIAADGQFVKKGSPLVVFDGAKLMSDLTIKQGQLREKLRMQEQLRLNLADRAREAELATAQARADLDKAERKANQPKEYVARVLYQKLVVARSKAERTLALTMEKERVAAQGRAAEQRMADVDVNQLQSEVDGLQHSLAALKVLAPRDGIVVHQDDWRGGKIDVGSQVWLGQTVAHMPDLSTLAVHAALPERELTRVHRNQRVLVVLSGGGDRRLGGTIADIGYSVHSKSRVEAVPVVDITVQLDPGDLSAKPGQPVQVEIPAEQRSAP